MNVNRGRYGRRSEIGPPWYFLCLEIILRLLKNLIYMRSQRGRSCINTTNVYCPYEKQIRRN